MEIIRVNEKEILNSLYCDSAFTIEGLTEDSILDFVNWTKEYTPFKAEEKVYLIKGKTMNENYQLTEDNRYPDDLTIVSIMLSDLEKPFSLVTARFEIGGRWFDDIVDNNARREERGADY